MRASQAVFSFTISAVVLWACSSSHAGTIIDSKTYAQYDAAMSVIDPLDAVGKISWTGGYASGTYLGDGWVLTAAHVADSASSFNFTINGHSYASAEVHLYPTWTGDVTDGGDTALIKLNTPTVYAQAAQLYDGSTNGLLNKVVNPAGYGRTGNGVTGDTGAGGVLHAGENLVERRGGNGVFFKNYDSSIVFFDFDDPSNPDPYAWSINAALDYEYMIAPGDSGGPAFTLVNNTYVVAATNSFMLVSDGSTNASYTDIGSLASIAEFRWWYTSVAGTDFTDTPAPPPFLPGDFNGDYYVDQFDLNILLLSWGSTHQPSGWVGPFDGQIDQTELNDLLAYWGQNDASSQPLTGTPLPEPASLTLLALGGLAGLIRRR